MANPDTNTIVRPSIRDMIARGRQDPAKFAYDFLNIELYDAQIKFIRESTKPTIKESNFSAGNRSGKSELVAVKLLWMAFYQIRNPKFATNAQGKLNDYTAINVSVSLDQASIVFNKASGYAQNSPRLQHYIDNVKYSPFPELTFKPVKGAGRGAQIWARSTAFGAKYLLGQNFQYLNFDEAALEPNGEIIMNDVIRMRMADSGGTIDTTSQPRGKNWFYHHFIRGLKTATNSIYDPACYSQYGSSFDNPYIDHDHIRRSMRYMTPSQIEENIYGHFSDISQFFPADRIQLCYKDQDYALPVPPRHDIVTRTRDGETYQQLKYNPESDPLYVMGVDLASKQDDTCIVIFRIDVHPWQLVRFELLGRMDWSLIKQRIAQLHKEYNAWGYVDATGAGQPVHSDLIHDFDADLEGFIITESSKQTLLYELQLAIQNRDFVFPYIGINERDGTRPVVDQLTNYQLKDKNLRTDAVFGLALAVKAARDALERSLLPQVVSIDEPLVIATRDVRTGGFNFHTLDDDDEFDDDAQGRTLRRWSYLVDM